MKALSIEYPMYFGAKPVVFKKARHKDVADKIKQFARELLSEATKVPKGGIWGVEWRAATRNPVESLRYE